MPPSQKPTNQLVPNMPLKSAFELFIALFYANNCASITGITRLMKIMFLLINEGGFKHFLEELDFEAYDFGPYSTAIHIDYPRTLEYLGIVESEVRGPYEIDPDAYRVEESTGNRNVRMNTYGLTQAGKEVARLYYERLLPTEQVSLEQIKTSWNNVPLSDLLGYVYTNYLELTGKSKIKNKIFSKMGVSSKLIALIGTIPRITSDNEKEEIADAIERSFA